jgi:hypothetical protein
MPDADTGDIDDTGGRAARKIADGDAEIRDTHPRILSGRGRVRG